MYYCSAGEFDDVENTESSDEEYSDDESNEEYFDPDIYVDAMSEVKDQLFADESSQSRSFATGTDERSQTSEEIYRLVYTI